MLECAVDCGEVLDPPLALRVVVPNYANTLQRLVLRKLTEARKRTEFRAPKVASKKLARSRQCCQLPSRAVSSVSPSRE